MNFGQKVSVSQMQQRICQVLGLGFVSMALQVEHLKVATVIINTKPCVMTKRVNPGITKHNKIPAVERLVYLWYDTRRQPTRSEYGHCRFEVFYDV